MKTLMRATAFGALLATASVAVLTPTIAGAQTPAAPPAADSMFRATTLNLAAQGEVRVQPDMATITIGVQTDGKTAAEAMEKNAAQMNGVIAALRRAGIGEREIQTSGLNLNPQYVYQESQPPRLNGYQASNQVSVRVLELGRLGPAIDSVVASGANQINGISFGLRDPSVAENQARRDAVRALEAKTALYAGATGHRVGRLVTLSEGGGYSPPPPMPMAMARVADFAEKGTPTSGGELAVRIDVTALYELVR